MFVIFPLQVNAPASVPVFGGSAPAPAPFGFDAGRVGGGGRVRHRKILRDNMYSVLPKCTVKRIMHRGGVGRMSGLIPDEIRDCLRVRDEHYKDSFLSYSIDL